MNQRRLSTPIIALVVLGALALPAGVAVLSLSSGANFADDERFTGNRLGAGSVEVAVSRSDVDQVGPGRVSNADPAMFSATNLAPGDHVTGALAVDNNGTLPLRFWVTAKAATSAGALSDWLLFDAWVGDDCRAGLDAADQVHTTNLVLGPTHARLIGDPTSTGDELRLEPGEELVVCVGAHLPLAAPNEVQAATVDVELIVAAQHALTDGGADG